MLSGLIIGYDPGGNGAHGVAELWIEEGKATSLSTQTMATTEDVIVFLEKRPSIAALGVDTLTCWSTGRSAWRPADRWLRQQQRYKPVRASIVSPNSLSGSMGLNGMATLIAVRVRRPEILITETHPKVLYYHLSGQRYDYEHCKTAMDATLAAALGVTVTPATEHEWDAALSAFAALEGVEQRWPNDLHRLATETGERLVSPCGITHYFWPE
jgi:Protein of unknown function (DUF429)